MEGEGAKAQPSASDHAAVVERRYAVPFALVTSLFFSWALAAALNDVLIRQFQKALALSRTEASLIQLAFYIGYFIAAVPAGLIIRWLGYKQAILIGLGLYAVGAFLFYPAAAAARFPMFLGALLVIAFGLACLETAANPYITILGDPATASARLNLAQGFYGVGAILGPVIGGLFIFSGVERSHAEIAEMSPAQLATWRSGEALMVQGPYLAIGFGVCLLALLIAVTRFPDVARSADPVPKSARPFTAALRHPRLVAAVAAQFFYVGAQVGVWSFFIDFAKDRVPSLTERQVAFLLSASLGMLMLGRFSGAWALRHVRPALLLCVYAGVNVALCALATMLPGAAAVGALWLTSFFMSIMFPTIFALGIEGLGGETESGSAFLIMAIIGGALIPPAMGLVSDTLGGVHHMMVVPALCFAVPMAFAAHLLRQDA